MQEFNLIVDVEEDAPLDEVTRELQERLARLESVDEVGVMPVSDAHMRVTGMEIAAGIAVTIVIVRSSRELVEESRKLFAEIRGFIGDLRGVRNAWVDVGSDTEVRRVPIDQLTDEDYRELTEAI